MKNYYDGDKCLKQILAIVGHTQFIGFLKGNVYKYVYRMGRKGDAAEDVKKAVEYLRLLMHYDSVNAPQYMGAIARVNVILDDYKVKPTQRRLTLEYLLEIF